MMMGGGNNLKRQNQIQQQSIYEYEQKEKELQERSNELKGNMDDTIKMAIVDYMNLVFGSGEETGDFWNTVLLPYVSQYYGYNFDELKRSTKYLNALFFAFTKHFGIKIMKPIVT